MTIDLNDPKMAGYIALDEIVEDNGGVAGGKVAEEVQLSVTALTFPDTGSTYESPSQAIVITNTGYDQVTIYGVHVEGEFTLKSSVPGSLQPGESASVNVSFKPISVGAKTGSVYFDTGNAALGQGDVGTYTFALAQVSVTTGATIAGSNLNPAYVASAGGVTASATALSGTWRNLGNSVTGFTNSTLFLRVS